MADHSYPQHGDEPDAANFAAMLGHSNHAPYITNLTISVDASNANFDTTQAKAFSFISTFDTASPDISPIETRRDVIIEHELDARANIALTDQDTNYIYLQPNVGTDDSAQYVVNTTGSAPDSSSFKIAEIDVDSTIPDSSVREYNRYPDAEFGELDTHGRLTILEDLPEEGAADLPQLVFEDSNGDKIRLEMGGTIFDFDAVGTSWSTFRFRFDNNSSLSIGDDEIEIFNRLEFFNSNNSYVDLVKDVAPVGTVTLSGGTAVIDTGVSDNSASFFVGLGVVDPGADAKVDYRVFWDDSAGTHKIEIFEDGTTVGGFDVNYNVVRMS